MEYNCEFLRELNETQRYVCESEDNFILTACPGSGKTRTITYRLAYLAEKYKESKKINIAITYTNRAANEIEDRLTNMDIDTSNIWTGTIHQFCMKYIIRPYSMYHDRLSKGYRIIDEYVKEEYLKASADKLGMKKYYIKDLYKNQPVLELYNACLILNKEIDFDMILRYAHELIEKYDFIAENVSCLIRSLHIDEYQDTNEKQYQILAGLIKANPNINVLFVGDVNQAIYGNLGGVAKSASEIRDLIPIQFTEKCLEGCYRSTQRIVDYYVNFEVSKTGVYSVAPSKDNPGVIRFDSTISKEKLADEIAHILKDELEKGVPEDDICIVAPQWYQIYPMANRLRKILPHNHFDAPDISPIKYDPLNVFFLIGKLLFTKTSKRGQIRRKEASEILTILEDDYGINVSDAITKLDVLKSINSITFIQDDGIKTLENAIKNLFSILNIAPDGRLEKTQKQFFEKINQRVTEHKLPYDCEAMEKSFKEKTGIVVTTIHGVKGEEYSTVIAFDLLNGHLPHWDYIMEPKLKGLRLRETKKLLYVLCSRAKENLYLFSENGRTTSNGYPLSCTDELLGCCFVYDN